ncbi:hypothetical protein L596_020529 [Steinernema carpocapsae]|uniref:Uncharacterized protein n=1 Tax=Steinernema carpocapsae TaxID=34508 RepID=A0A4U5MTT6_STECR|nr:hypothetical protein L596_020529 [Steinernema carpocapsae]
MGMPIEANVRGTVSSQENTNGLESMALRQAATDDHRLIYGVRAFAEEDADGHEAAAPRCIPSNGVGFLTSLSIQDESSSDTEDEASEHLPEKGIAAAQNRRSKDTI